jgi:ubiquinone biosynthesis UbiH/UbiF/VisC/COQ6 family hydroxylase
VDPCDIAVVGAGLAGKAFALAATQPDSGSTGRLSVTLMGQPERTPSVGDEFDARVYALSPGNAAFLDALGVWERIDAGRRTPVWAMRVHGDDGSLIEFDAYRVGVPALAWIVEDGRLQRALEQRLDASDAVAREPGPLARISVGESRVTLRSESGESLEAQLVVGADGSTSRVREYAGIPAKVDDYRQLAVVANFECERPHRNVALQWFQGGPVLALLPLPGNRVSMVWSVESANAQDLLALDPDDLARRVENASAGELGRLRVITKARGLPLARVRARRSVAPRVALIGDAAHVVHPLAGQGANLGLQDARVLAQLLAARAPFRDPGDLRLLRGYERARAEPTLLMQHGIHGLQRLFAAHTPAARFVRNRGLNLVDRIPVVKNLLARQAMA